MFPKRTAIKDCLVCLCSRFYKQMSIGQPVVLFKCPHQNSNTNSVIINLSHFWSNVQMLTVITYICGMYNSFKLLSEATNNIQQNLNIMQLAVNFAFIVNLTFIFTKQDRVVELQSIQGGFEKHAEAMLPHIFNNKEIKTANTLNSLIMIVHFVSLLSIISYSLYNALYTSQYAICMTEFLVFYSSPNIMLFYIYTYYLAYRINENINKKIMAILKARLKNQHVLNHDILQRYVTTKKIMSKVIVSLLNKRAVAIVLVIFFVGICGVLISYIFIKNSIYVICKHYAIQYFQFLMFLTLIVGLCVAADMVPHSVRNLLFIIKHTKITTSMV